MADEETIWIVTDDGLVNPYFGASPAVMETPLPYQYWRISPLAHNGRPYHELLPDVERINPTPVDERPVEDYIIVYDMLTKQNEFTGHGLAVLCPTVCEITEELNGAYQLIMEHPKDPDGKWEYLLEWNIIKARGQLFIIQKRKDNWRQGKSSVTVWADHITYQLNDDWIFPGATINPGDPPNGTSLLYGIMFSANAGIDKSQMTYYEFTAASDVEIPAEFHDWDTTDSGATPYAMIIGSNGFISKFGGELHRDNFYFSINQRMENADDNAFELRVGKNMIGINKTIDISTACFYFRVYDQFGQWYALSWAERDWLRGFPRTIVRSETITVPDTIPAEGWWDYLFRYASDHFSRYCAPLISYEITVKDLKKNPEFSMFQNIDRLKVGDKGKVWDVDFSGYLNIEITKTVTNAITGEVTEVTFGSTRSFTRPYGYNPIPGDMFTPIPVGGEGYLQDSEGYFLEDSEGNMLYEEVVING